MLLTEDYIIIQESAVGGYIRVFNDGRALEISGSCPQRTNFPMPDRTMVRWKQASD